MSFVSPITFEEKLNNLEINFITILQKWETCRKVYNLNSKCAAFESQLNEILNNKIQDLKNNIVKASTTLSKEISNLNSNMSQRQSNKNIFTGNLMRLDRGDLAAEPRRVDAYEQKIYHLSNLFFYIVGMIVLIYYFKGIAQAPSVPRAPSATRASSAGRAPSAGRPRSTQARALRRRPSIPSPTPRAV